jgi:hypothetical protein
LRLDNIKRKYQRKSVQEFTGVDPRFFMEGVSGRKDGAFFLVSPLCMHMSLANERATESFLRGRGVATETGSNTN